MSKRSSKNSVRFSGRTWKLKKHTTLISGRNNIDPLTLKREKRKERKTTKIENQFNLICQKFQRDFFDIESQKMYSDYFLKIKLSSERIKTIQRIKSFKLFCERYGEEFSLEKYFVDKYNLIDYKSEFPDVYFFNYIKRIKKFHTPISKKK